MEERAIHDESDEALALRAGTDPAGPSGRAAAGELLARYDARVYGWCRRMVRDPERALEVSQEALLAAYRGLGTFAGRARFSSWLYSVTRRCCLRELGRAHFDVVDGVDLDALLAGDEDPGAALVRKEEQALLLELIETELDTVERTALWLRCEEGLGVEEITRMLHLTTASGARGVLQSARRKLRSALEAREKNARREGLG